MKTALLLTVASLATVLGAANNKPVDEVKPDAAAGRYNRPRPSYGSSSPSYSNGGGYGYPSYGPGYWQPLIQDRFVCDLDASVLLVVDSNRHHHNRPQPGYGYSNPSVPANRAVRVKCSEVANHDEDSCNFCCQQTARRDTTLPNDALFGFLAIVKTDDDETFKRDKRGADHDDDDDDDDDDDKDHRRRGGKYHRVDSTYVSEADWEPSKYRTNVKCVCCAPRINPAAQNPSTYNTAAAPPAASNPTYNGNGNTFGAVQPVPVPAAASQPLVDSWQSDNSWSTGAAQSPPAGNTWSTGSQTPPANSWSTGSAPQAPPATNTWNTAAAAQPVPANNNWNSRGNNSPAIGSDSGANSWGAASDATAAPAPPPAITQAPIAAASNTY
ncbi:hypothetical protein CRE_26727 [Caenorhabditis remanei]|uniref:Uncharacterized protein n=1 Tax=Caenorhabditis remanei TaxID=31234 RepID=E3MXW4_CAERE|nr:hypothetical protein CRE_26727 [Caenorhabditis remanei]